jgi:hypothetical protein
MRYARAVTGSGVRRGRSREGDGDDTGKRPPNIVKKLPPEWSVGITASQTSSEVHEAIARFR